MLSKEKRLGDIAEIITGLIGFNEDGTYSYRVVQPNNFNDAGAVNGLAIQYRSDRLSDKSLLSLGDILLKRLNPSFVHIVNEETTGAAASQNLLVVRPSRDVDPFYLGYLLEQKEIIGQVEHVTGSAAAIKAVSVKKLADIKIPFISLDEQRKVGEIWKLSRRRRQLLKEYMEENDRLISMLATQIINSGGNTK